MPSRFRFRSLVLAVPLLMAFPLVVTTAGCGGGGTKVETTSGPSAEEVQAQKSYEDIMKEQAKKGGVKIVK
ncbi:MAG TPA: hypothetical protein VF590_07240 [Isosphaeraceae bacterium]|jgi:hypothetical protein